MTTKLEVINAMLGSVGTASQSDPDSQHPDAVDARELIEGKLKEMLMKGWWFNTDYYLPLAPDQDGNVILPQNTLQVDPSDPNLPYVQRGNKLYDPVNHTFKLATTVYVDIRLRLEIEDLPEAAAMYLKVECKRAYYIDQDGDDNKAAQYLRDLNIALAELKKQNLSALNLNARARPRVAAILAGIRPATTYAGASDPRYPGGRPV